MLRSLIVEHERRVIFAVGLNITNSKKKFLYKIHSRSCFLYRWPIVQSFAQVATTSCTTGPNVASWIGCRTMTSDMLP